MVFPRFYGIKRTANLFGMNNITQWMNFNTGIFETLKYPGSAHITDSLPLVTALYDSEDPIESVETFFLTQIDRP